MTGGPRPLTRREWVVLCLWVSGATRQQIADSLGVGIETARSYVASISDKRGLHGRFDALRMGVEDDRPPVADTPGVMSGG